MSTSATPSAGDTVSHVTTITTEDVEAFVDGTGDTNPLHTDADYASDTRFDEPISHGMLVAGTIGAALQKLPGVVVWLEQSLSFEQPVYHGDTVEVTCTLTRIEESGKCLIDAVVERPETDDIVIRGDGVILLDT